MGEHMVGTLEYVIGQKFPWAANLMKSEFGDVVSLTMDKVKEKGDYSMEGIEKACDDAIKELGLSASNVNSDFTVPMNDNFDDVKNTAETDSDAIYNSFSKTFGTDLPGTASTLESSFGTPVKTTIDGIKDTAETDSIQITGYFGQSLKTDLPATATGLETNFATPVKTSFGDVRLTAETDSAAVATAVDQSFNTDLAATAQDSQTGFFDVIGDAFRTLKAILIGDPIVYDIRDGIIEGFSDWITQTSTDVGSWVTDREKNFTDLLDSVNDVLSDLTSNISKGFSEINKGIQDKCREILDTVKEKFTAIKDMADNKLNSETLNKNGLNVIKGLGSGMKTEFSTLMSTIRTNVTKIKTSFTTKLTSSTLVSTGKNLIEGLKSGLVSALNGVLQTVTDICNKITEKAKAAFQVHSPSRVFINIGTNLMKGLVEGVDDHTKEVDESFKDLVPGDDLLIDFELKYDEMLMNLSISTQDNLRDLQQKYIETLKELQSKTESSMNAIKDIYINTFKAISDAITNLTTHLPVLLDYLARQMDDAEYRMMGMGSMRMFEDLSRQVDSAASKLHNAAVDGKLLPSSKEFIAAMSNLSVKADIDPKVIKQAIIDALTTTGAGDLQSEDKDISINIDGRAIFNIVRSENTKFKKQHGISAFA
jgi:ElaB/YqjD/DUF883 family membrane-anchored ribosome-binding protein